VIVTLTTDLGQKDGYVAGLKGAMLSVSPEVRFIDVSHTVGTQDVMEAAFVLRHAAPTFPDDTVHLVVVGPQLGARRPLAARFQPAGSEREHLFVGPDNGVLSLLTDAPPQKTVVLDRPERWRPSRDSRPLSGRDVFAPVAAHLASGVSLREVGSPTEEIATLRWAIPRADEQGVEGWVVHVDHYGNCITNLRRETVEAHRAGREMKVYAGSTILRGISPRRGHVGDAEPVAVFGSDGALEIGVNRGHAASLLSLGRGSAVRLVFETRPARARRLADAG
jgi:S-adenosylmethionine hydrolase